ncbi:MAG: hypothetical protein FWG53_01625 [Clostridiales bacterium]|nr:hypothetical protein [Clostridiales bacterium]
MKASFFKHGVQIALALMLIVGSLTIPGVAIDEPEEEGAAAGVTVVSTVSLSNSEYAQVALTQWSSNNDNAEIMPGVTLSTSTGQGKWKMYFAAGTSGTYSIYVHHGGGEASLVTIEVVAPDDNSLVEWEIGDGGGNPMSINHIKFGGEGPVTPIIAIIKNTDRDGKFKFAVTVGSDVNYATIRTGQGTDYCDYELPDNFTGTVTISELEWFNGSDSGLAGWAFDDSVYEFVFLRGQLVSPEDSDLIVAFENSYTEPEPEPEPEINVTKVSDAGANGRIANGQTVNYEVIVENTYDESIKKVVISDSRFGIVDGDITVWVKQSQDEDFIEVLAGEDYSFTEDGDIAFDKSFTLDVGGKIKLEYAITWTGAGSHTNTVEVTGVGTESKVRVKGNDDVTVTIPDGGGTPPTGGKRPPTPGGNTTISDPPAPLAEPENPPEVYNPPVDIPQDEVPLSDIPKTGLAGLALPFTIAGVSLAALLAVLFTRKREAK